jgi:hypothetical protein
MDPYRGLPIGTFFVPPMKVDEMSVTASQQDSVNIEIHLDISNNIYFIYYYHDFVLI